jgi:hypothetical protein
MKKVILLTLFLPFLAMSQANITSWKLNTTGHQAQYYNSSNLVQDLNDSSEVLEVCYNSDTLYVRTSMLASFIMGDWPGDPFLADGQNKKYNFPRNPNSNSTTHKSKPQSVTGLLVNGVPIYDDGDGKSYNTSTNKNDNSGSGVWNQLAWIAHAAEMDAGNAHPDPGIAFTESEARGLEVFRKSCENCHREPLFTNNGFANNGLEPDDFLKDGGRIKITGQLSDSLKFKVPTLRNIEVSYPYMHDGRYRNLQMVLFHYSNNISKTINLAPELSQPLDLNEQNKNDLIAFLKTLTDTTFLNKPEFGYPMRELGSMGLR